MKPRTPIFGLMAEFETAQAVLRGDPPGPAGGLSARWTPIRPIPVEGLVGRARDWQRTQMPFVVLVGGLVGAGVGFVMQWYSMAVDYPFNVGRAALQ